ncbi:MAG TPA: NUDIX hydrolase [Gemmataceae bacterium]|nr:NUDIX hydrolase [Gemmataceae bacterium]
MHIHKIEQLTHEKWLNLYAATFEHNGHSGRWMYASRKPQPAVPTGTKPVPPADAVIVVPVLRMPNEPPRLVMVKEFRVPVGDYVFAFPAGLIDAGESIEDAARRELLEETGLEVTAIHRITQPLYSSSGLTDEAVPLIFVDARSTPQSQTKLDASEDLEVVLLDFDGICRICDDCSLKISARAWPILYMYQQLGRLP